MKVFFDTSVLVAAQVESHPAHSRALAWLNRAALKEIEMVVSTHTLAELYAVLTRLPVRPRVDPALALRLIQENVIRIASIRSISAAQYKKVLQDLAAKNFSGGVVYDALAASVAAREGVEVLLTLNRADFARVWSGEESVLREP